MEELKDTTGKVKEILEKLAKPAFKGRVTINKREPPRCKVCKSAEVTHTISYFDRDNYLTHVMPNGRTFPESKVFAWSCDAHVVEVTYLVLKDAGVVRGDKEE